MALLERVATLLRANLNDLVEQAEDPVKMMRQIVLDMENQRLQVKTQVAIAIADHHLLEARRDENRAREADWMRKAELALDKKDEELARAALERAVASKEMAASFDQQIADQKVQVENLQTALRGLETKLTEARAQADVLAAQYRRTRSPVNRARDRAAIESVLNRAKATVDGTNGVEERFAQMEKDDEIGKLLNELKAKRASSPLPG